MEEVIEQLREANEPVPVPLELPDEDQLVEIEEQLFINIPFVFKEFLLTVSDVVPGWTEVLQQMRVGDEWVVYLPPALGYGEQGRPGIPPNAVLAILVGAMTIPGIVPTSWRTTSETSTSPPAALAAIRAAAFTASPTGSSVPNRFCAVVLPISATRVDERTSDSPKAAPLAIVHARASGASKRARARVDRMRSARASRARRSGATASEAAKR